MAPQVKPIEDRRLLGIGLALFGYLCFCVTDSCAKWLSLRGMPTTEVVFVRYLGQFIIVLGMIPPRAPKSVLVSRRPVIELLRGLCLLGSTVANFFALTFIPLTITASINFTMPLILCALSIPMLGEKIGWRRWLAIVIGFIGVLIIVRPGTAAFHPAMLLSLLAVSFSAFYFLFTRMLAGVDGTATQQFYSGAIATLCMLPFAFSHWVWPGDWTMWIPFLLIGAAATAGHQVLIIAHRFAPASTLAPFNYSLIVYMTISSWFVFGQPPDEWIFVGAPIVIASGAYIWWRERQLQKDLATEAMSAD